MRKIPTLFLRDDDDRRYVTDEVNPEARWVLEGDGIATRKYDGTCVMLDKGGRWWARREVKPGKTPPPNYRPVEHDKTTGKTVGWEPMEQSSFVKFHAEALERDERSWTDIPDNPGFAPGTYELVGPKINGNPEGAIGHRLIPHGAFRLDVPLTDVHRHVASLRFEGVVWHHRDGRMAKLKARDIRPERDTTLRGMR